MSHRKFLIYFLLSLVTVVVLMYLVSIDGKMKEYVDIAYYAVPAFSLLSILVYTITDIMERKPEKKGLLNIVIINVMLKFFISAIVIALYYDYKQPEDGIFVVPFIIVYVVFTIFETYFMSVQARTK